MVTCRTFETPAAGTIPLFLLEPELCQGDLSASAPWSCVLDDEDAHEKILDVLARPEHYAEIVMGIRRGFRPASHAPRRACAS